MTTSISDGRWRVDSEGVWLCPEHLDDDSLTWPSYDEQDITGSMCEACGRQAESDEYKETVSAVARAMHNHTGVDEIDWDATARVAIAAYEATL